MPRFDFDDVEFNRNILELELMTERAFLSRIEAWINYFRRVAA